MFACLHTSLQVKTRYQNDWSVTNQIEYTGLIQDSYIYFTCRLFYRKGPALRHQLSMTQGCVLKISQISRSQHIWVTGKICARAIRPITFYARSKKKGHIVLNRSVSYTFCTKYLKYVLPKSVKLDRQSLTGIWSLSISRSGLISRSMTGKWGICVLQISLVTCNASLDLNISHN